MYFATVKLELKQLRKPEIKPRKSTDLVGKDAIMTDGYAVEVRNWYAVLENESASEGAEEQWNILAKAIQKGVEVAIPERRRKRKKPWMMDEIFDMIDDRRHLKG